MDISARGVMNRVAKQSNTLIEIKGNLRDKLTSTLLEMMQDVHDACVSNHIEYALVGGSALGAVRHGGFIPWDDDIDISMYRSDFERFKEIFEPVLGEKYIFEAPNYKNKESKAVWGRVYKKGTTLWEVHDVNLPFERAIYIDVFIYDNVSKNGVVRRFDAFISDFMKGVATSMLYYKYPSKELEDYYGANWKALLYFRLRRLLGFSFSFISHKRWVNMFDKFVSRHKSQTGIITAPTGRKYYLGEILKQNWWCPMKLVPFEDKFFYVPAEPDSYLRNLFGDSYMELPPENKRERHFCVKLDFGKDS